MLFLTFYLGDERFALPCAKVREIIPLMPLKRLRQTPPYFAGVFSYRGVLTPVIDLRQLIEGISCAVRLSTRIIMISQGRADGEDGILGLMAERVTEVKQIETGRAVARRTDISKTEMEGSRLVAGVIMDGGEIIQRIDPSGIVEMLDAEMVHAYGSLPCHT